ARGRPPPRPSADRGAAADRPGDGAATRDRRHHPRQVRGADRDRRAVRAAVPVLGRPAARPPVHRPVPVRAGEDGRGDRAQRGCDADRVGQRPADARPDDLLAGDGHPASHRRTRREADGRPRHLDLAAPRHGLGLRRHGPVPARHDRRRPREDEPGGGHARDLPEQARGGVLAPDRARVPERRHARRRARGRAARRDGDAHGRRDRAQRRGARQRGPADRHAARRADGGCAARPSEPRPRLPRRRRGARGPARPGPSVGAAVQAAAGVRRAGGGARLRAHQPDGPRGHPAGLPSARADPAAERPAPARRGARLRGARRAGPRVAARARGLRGHRPGPRAGDPRRPAAAPGAQPGGSLPPDV
ncbi:MAG: DNA integrity scanning protein DisA, partial [uncultured Thermoleophilia bacterium]